jgi:hypothetical protein
MKPATAGAVLLAGLLCACSSAPAHNPEEYKTAFLFGTTGEAYQDTYEDDDVLTIRGTFRFRDGTTEPATYLLTFKGLAKDPPGHCVFEIDDPRNLFQGNLNSDLIVKRCDGADPPEEFQIGGMSIGITGTASTDADGLMNFHIKDLYAPKSVSYYSGHEPNDNSEDSQ